MAKIHSLRTCFADLGNLKFAALTLLCHCILLGRTCNLYKAADYAAAAGSTASTSSAYTRLVRFFGTGLGEVIQRGVLHGVLRLALSQAEGQALVMDRTEWKFGKVWHNMLVIGLVVRGCLVPLVWVSLPAHGNSNAQARLDLLKRLAAWWPHDHVPLKSFPLVADREFGGEPWLLQAARLGFLFVMRLKANRQVWVWLQQQGLRHRATDLRALRRYLARKGLTHTEIAIAGEYICHLVCLPNRTPDPSEPYLYLLTNLEDPTQAGSLYAQRWYIETCFKHLKSNGFQLEDQGFQLQYKVEILMAILALVYSLCVALAMTAQSQKPARLKNYRNNTQYRAKSLFRTGLSIALARLQPEKPFLLIVNELFALLSNLYARSNIAVE